MRYCTYEDLIVAKRNGVAVTYEDVRYILACHEEAAWAGGGEEYAEEFMAEVRKRLVEEGLLEEGELF